MLNSYMGVIGDAINAVYEWAAKETNPVKGFCKGFIAGWIDGWEYGCLIIGNIVCFAGVILAIGGKLKGKED